jgi:GH35 family endo-1,4-beta-xylanase
MVGNEDRNLYVSKMEIAAPKGTAQPRLGDMDKFNRELRARGEKTEQEVLKKTVAEIEKVRKRDCVIRILDEKGEPVSGAQVRVELLRHDFLFGCNIYMFDRFGTDDENVAYKRQFRELFNYATTGFYWASYEPVRGKPQYEYTDKVVAWCQKHNIRLKGHPLLWEHRAGKPRWAGNKQPPPEVGKQRVIDIMRRYSGKIEFWEVVNEPAHLPRLKIDDPYRWAREADPKAYLIVNDYYVMANGYPPFFRLLKKAIDDKVPFDGIGIQAHEPRTMRFPLDRCREILDHYATLGKELHITEFTPTSGGAKITGSHITGVWDEDTQADYSVKFTRVCFAHPAVVALTWWDLCERGAWLKGGGLLRKDVTPKKVYTAMKKLIHEEWKTLAQGKTGSDGKFAFRGFHGIYIVTATAAGKTTKNEFHLGKKGACAFDLTVGK